MKKIILIVGGGMLLILSIVIIYALNWNNASEPNKYLPPVEDSNKQYQTQSDNQASVTIDVIPKQLGIKEEKNIFFVSLNTHTVDLDFNFVKIMILSDDLGTVYSAREWTGGRGGHHLNGYIIFPKINPKAKQVKLQINDIGGVNRNFEWSLNLK